MKNIKFLEHTADIKFQAFGENLEKAFENAALALTKSMYGGKVKAKKKATFNVKGQDLESLLYSFLEEFLFLFEAKGLIASKIKVKISKDKKSLSAEILGDNSKNYKIETHIKAITYNEMFVKQEKGKWVCQVVLDI
jgi:SHS2 domain-containing protein